MCRQREVGEKKAEIDDVSPRNDKDHQQPSEARRNLLQPSEGTKPADTLMLGVHLQN